MLSTVCFFLDFSIWVEESPVKPNNVAFTTTTTKKEHFLCAVLNELRVRSVRWGSTGHSMKTIFLKNKIKNKKKHNIYEAWI